MGERKGLNKYFPPDFDPKKIPRRLKHPQKKIRGMVPVPIRCNTCGNYMREGTKTNSRHEEVTGETYLGIKIHRFYFKCTNCCAEIILKTDQQSSSYVVEAGATRIYQQSQQQDQADDDEDVMSSLEKRSLVYKREIGVMAALDELKSMKSRRMSVSVESMLENLSRKEKDEVVANEEEEDVLIKSIRFGEQRRMTAEADERREKKRRMMVRDEKKPETSKRLACIITLKKKKTTSTSLTSLCNNYGSDEED